jgi:hypothetical protein
MYVASRQSVLVRQQVLPQTFSAVAPLLTHDLGQLVHEPLHLQLKPLDLALQVGVGGLGEWVVYNSGS